MKQTVVLVSLICIASANITLNDSYDNMISKVRNHKMGFNAYKYGCPVHRGCIKLQLKSVNCETYLSFGTIVVACGRTYLLGMREMTMTRISAANVCSDLGMTLASFETEDELNCFHEKLLDDDVILEMNEFWVSATCEKRNCPIKFVWETGAHVVFDLLSPSADSFSGGENSDIKLYLAIRVDSANYNTTFSYYNKTVRYRPLCEASANMKNSMKMHYCPPSCPLPNNEPGMIIARNPNEHGILLTSLGDVMVKCGKTYFMNFKARPQYEAVEFCLRLGMRILSIETRQEAKCINDNYKDYKGSGYEFLFWTSAWRSDCSNKFMWCAYSEPSEIMLEVWEDSEPNNYDLEENCAMVPFGGNFPNLEDSNCEGLYYVMCETDDIEKIFYTESEGMIMNPKTPNQSCLPQCIYSSTVQKSIITKVKGKKVEKCNTTYYVSYSESEKMNKKEAIKLCSSRGMAVLSFESFSEQSCVVSMLEERNMQATEYWTSAIGSDNCPETYRWCNEANEPLVSDQFSWLNTQVDGVEKCVSAAYYRPLFTVFLSLSPCSQKLNVICEKRGPSVTYGSIYTTSKLLRNDKMAVTAAPATITKMTKVTTKASVPTAIKATVTLIPQTTLKSVHNTLNCIDYCLEFNNLIATNNVKTSTTKSPSSTIMISNRAYLISDTQLNFSSALKFCSSKQMILVTIESTLELNSIATSMVSNKQYSNLQVWASGSDRKCQTKFTWCSGADILKEMWGDTKPSSSSEQRCVKLQVLMATKNANLMKESCSSMLRVMCEPK